MSSNHLTICLTVAISLLSVGIGARAETNTCTYECEGQFRAGHECSMAVDGDWMTSAVPDAYGASVNIIEHHVIPSGVGNAKWRFKVLNNTADIDISAYYWDYVLEDWDLFYDVPLSLDYETYTRDIPANGLLTSPLKTKMYVKNASSPLMSGEYFEGVVDWIYPDSSPNYQCEGQFRAGFECSKAVDGDWTTAAVPDAYGDSIKVIEEHVIPPGANAAHWNFRVLRNWVNIEVRADYWNYNTANWEVLYLVPLNTDWYTVYTVEVPSSGLLFSPLVTRMHVKNATSPLVSGMYFEGAVDWCLYPSDSLIIPLDIKPGSCPNPLNVKVPKIDSWAEAEESPMASKLGPGGLQRLKAVLPVAILGTAEFDVVDIDPASVALEGVPARRWNTEDVSTPVSDTTECACNSLGTDNYTDLTLKFERDAIIEALGTVYNGDMVPLTITGELYDGTPFEGTDCVVIIGNRETASTSATYEKDPATALLLGNYPNPFNPATEISFSLPNAADVRLEVYNIMGQKVATLVDRHVDAGEHTARWDASGVASGIYFYRLEAGEFFETRKMVLLK